jgi:hypothetical protein
VNGAPVVNVRSLQASPDEKPWLFLRYELLKPNLLSVRSVRETAFAGVTDSAAELRKSLEQSKDEHDTDEDAFVCLKLE